MIPPQVRPTPKASSSLIPYLRYCGTPLSRISRPTSKSAPSTQPPLTEPTASWPLVTSMAAPAGRGADFQVRTTVAMATGSPAR